MELDDYFSEAEPENFDRFVNSLKNTNWMITASENTIDSLFNCSIELQDTFGQEKNKKFCESLIKKYPGIDFQKSVNLLLGHLLRSQHLNEALTLYAIEKYILLFSKNEFRLLLDNMLAEVKLQEHLYQLNEELPQVDLDWYKINSLLSEISENEKTSCKVFNALSTQTSLLLKSINHSSLLNGQSVIDRLINVLESQRDLKLWFILLRDENINIILELCAKYENFLSAILNFFDKFANEVESNYDEELNVKYSHVNLDFEDFVQVFQSFLNFETIKNVVIEYLDKKIQLEDKNFCFWIDVKACLKLD